MKTYILTSKLQVDEEDIQKARRWAHRRGYDYKKDIAHMVFDYITDGKDTSMLEADIEEEKTTLAR